MDRLMRVPVFIVNLAAACFLALLATVLWLQGRASTVAGVDVPAVNMSEDARLAAGITAAVLAVLTLGVAVVVLAPRRRRGVIALHSAEGGSVVIPAQNVEQTVAEDVRSLHAVMEASASASEEKGGIAVDLAVTLRPEAELPAAIEEISSRVDSALVRRYGAKMSRKPHIEVRFSSAREDARAEVKSPAPTA